MPFRPLPKSFTDHLARLDPEHDPVLELGSGDGAFSALLTACGVRPWRLDRLRGPSGAVDVVGDARQAPFRSGGLAAVVAPNLVRHLAPRRDLGRWVARWRTLLKPGGRLYVFEDEPGNDTPARRNFRDLQDLLARLMPESRGPLLTARRFADLTADHVPAGDWTWGTETNAAGIDAGAVMRMLGAGAGADRGPVAGLIRRIGRDGIAPERYWWARLDAEGQGGCR
jgi:SAM-dependent methyltransferase